MRGRTDMNPFKVNRIINEYRSNDIQISIDRLSEDCGGKLKHSFLRMSRETFLCTESGGFPRHWVEGLKLHSWITLWFYHPPKFDLSAINNNVDSLKDIE